MEENQRRTPDESRPVHPRRRKRSKWQNFKEAYLPVIILAAAVILIISFVVGAIRRSSGKPGDDPSSSSASTVDPQLLLQQEQGELLEQAAVLAKSYDYQAAMDLLSTYSAGISTSTMLTDKFNEYSAAQAALVPFSDLSQVPNLAVRMLIADLERAVADPDHGAGFNRNFITTSEFSKILDQLYANGYMLVTPYDMVTQTTAADGKTTFAPGTVYLPPDKKPIILTQLGCNFFTYIVDGDGDGLPDKDGSGIPYRLALDDSGNLTSQMVDAAGNDLSGSYDFVTILNDFVAAHPDFSYKGAKGVLAMTGYDGLFGYRTDPETAEKISPEFYDKQLADVKPIIEKVRADGFDIASMSYDYVNYASQSVGEVRKDLDHWNQEVVPLLGTVDLMVLPYDDLIPGRDLYTGEIYDLLTSNGFRFYMAKGSHEPWGQITENYVRMNFLQITGKEMHSSPEIFRDLFDASAVLDSNHKF